MFFMNATAVVTIGCWQIKGARLLIEWKSSQVSFDGGMIQCIFWTGWIAPAGIADCG